jgi:hypothetical protein
VAGPDASPPVSLVVLNRTIRSWTLRRGKRVSIAADVAPSSRGETVVLQMRLRERFGWWPVRTRHLDRFSHVRFVVTRRKAVSVRVVLTLPDGATPLAISPVMRVSGLHRPKSRG